MDHFKHVFATHHDASGAPLLTSSQMSLIVSILSAGTTIGSFSMSFVGELFGRRINLIFGCAVFALSVALRVAASAIPLFAVGRLFAGLGLGFISALVPLYQSEAAPKWIRTFGSTSFIHCFTNDGRQLYRFLVVTTVQALQQLSGINFIFYCGTDFSEVRPHQSLCYWLDHQHCQCRHDSSRYVRSRENRPSQAFAGRCHRYVRCRVHCCHCRCQSQLSRCQQGLDRFPVPVHSFFASTWGPVAWVVTGETFSPPNSIQECRTLHYVELDLEFRYRIRDPLNMVDSGPGNANLGPKVFFIWGTFCLVAVFFVYFFVYETKGLSLEEV
ncbi:hypothetical protein POJ06DRAFT_99767 [Lipomyces tetrasporus]|uniref:Major facilitator superfamily (MFS) profile domain-containing protein n=1 Tax=Lipomyces tetrasporus TaxID=54092 RepID=A0AAD7QSL1_9ASCO|nr:uncharacterized protein POJ06DRAFT_99767 [Lipomyces tetrasporus]KAJ8100206.1 hypothetical protein POJ06DRAFT_99767 [Lipomyces tetrasporus]